MSDQLSQAFAALSDPTRRDIVQRLAQADATLTDLAAHYPVSVQAIAKHLSVLRDAGLISRTREAQRRPVHLEPEVLDLMTGWIERYRRQAEQRYQRLDAALADLDQTNLDQSDLEKTDLDNTEGTAKPLQENAS